jgi:hypothetical protein
VTTFNTDKGTFYELILPLLTGPRPLIVNELNKVNAPDRIDFLDMIQAAPAFQSGSPNLVFATPNGLAGFPVLRMLVPPDIPDLSAIYVPKSLFDGQTILAAVSDDTPVAVVIDEQRLLGRKTGGNIAALNAVDVLNMLGIPGIGLAWTTPSFDAANFTAEGEMTWTVEAGDVITFDYTLIGKTMLLKFVIVTSDIGGTPNNGLYIKIPASAVNAKKILSTSVYIQNSGNYLGYIYSESTWTTLKIMKLDNSNFATGVDATAIYGEIFLEIS